MPLQKLKQVLAKYLTFSLETNKFRLLICAYNNTTFRQPSSWTQNTTSCNLQVLDIKNTMSFNRLRTRLSNGMGFEF